MLIGEVAARSGLSARMLRHYDSVGLLSPSGRTTNGYREYADDDLRRLFHVEALRALGLTLQEVATALDGPSFSAADTIEAVVDRVRERLARDEALLRRLQEVRANGPGAWSDVLNTIGLLQGLRSGSPSTRQRAVMSLSQHGGGEAALLARAALDEPDPNVAGALYWALARAGDDGLAVLVEGLGSGEAERRHRAVAALTKLGSPGAAAALAGALSHPDPLVSGRAALVRGRHGDTDAIPRLVALVVDGVDDVEAAGVLGELAALRGCAETIVGLIGDALADADHEARRRLAAALAEVPGPSAQATLIRLSTDRDRAVALTATAVLRRLDRARLRAPRRSSGSAPPTPAGPAPSC